MLSYLNLASSLNKFSNTKCAEIYCQSLDHFSIICTFCELKTFEFEDFLLHFKNVHVEKNQSQGSLPAEVDIKFEPEGAEAVPMDDGALEFQDIKILTVPPQENFEDITSADHLYKEEKCQEQESISDSDLNYGESSDELYTPKVLKISPAKSIHITEYKCKECEKSYKLPKFLQHHVNKCHNKGQIFKCPRCDIKFSDERMLTSHMQNIHDGFPCGQCDKTYKSKESLHLHVFNHTGVRNFICDVDQCGKAFFNPKTLSNHKRMVHTVVRNYVCEMCGFRTKAKPALIVHKRSHTGEKPFACKVCDRRFASQSLLGEHKAMHLTDRPHKCDVCGATFARHKALYHHKHLHLGIKKFLCKICGKSYAQAAGLSGHMRQHKSE